MTSVPFVPQNNFIDNIDLQAEQAINNGPSLHVNGQNFALIIYLAPHGTKQRNIEAGMMILGTFQTEELARAHIKKLARLGYIYFDIYIVSLYSFFPLPPPNDMGDNTTYINEEMNKIMDYHRRAVVAEQEDVQRRVQESRIDEETKSKARSSNAPAPTPNGEKQSQQQCTEPSIKVESTRQCTEEERKKLKMVIGEPIFVQEKDIPAGAPVIDLSNTKLD
jgi:hypothetical protein